MERGKDKELREAILRLLEEAGREGLTLGELTIRLFRLGKSASERTVRRVLRELLWGEGNGEPLLVTTTRRGQGPGRQSGFTSYAGSSPSRCPYWN